MRTHSATHSATHSPVESTETHSESVKSGNFIRLNTSEEIKDFLRHAKEKIPCPAVDTETDYRPDNGGVIRYISEKSGPSVPNNFPFLFIISTDETAWVFEYTDEINHELKVYLESRKELIMANALYDLHMMRNVGIYPGGKIWDVLIMHHLYRPEDYNEEGKRIRGLKDISDKYLGDSSSQYEEALKIAREELAKERGIKVGEVPYSDIPRSVMTPYAGADGILTAQLKELFEEKLRNDNLLDLYNNIEAPAINPVLRTERRGFRVNQEKLEALRGEVEDALDKARARLMEQAEKEFNPDSANELVEVYESFGIEYDTTTEKGFYQTNEEALTQYLNHSNTAVREFTETLLEYRDNGKLLHTFIDGVYEFIQEDGAVHPSFWLTGTRTGRMSSSNPNFQNYPKQDKRIRSVYSPRPGHVLMFFDYAQQEYRLLAHYSQDKQLVQAVNDGLDIHRATAAQLFETDYDAVTDKQRSDGKTMNFAMVYGLGLSSIAQAIGLPINKPVYDRASQFIREMGYKPWKLPSKTALLNEARNPQEQAALEYYFSDEAGEYIKQAGEFKKMYFERYPAIKDFIYASRRTAERRGYVFTWAKRRRYLGPEEAYKAPNTIIQGGCGDILKQKAGEIDKLLKPRMSGVVNYIHDEIVIEMAEHEFDLIPEIRAVMEDLDFRVPMQIDVEWSKISWADKEVWNDLQG